MLATGSARRWATVIVEHLGVFSQVYATENGRNLTSKQKADELIHQYGEKGFDYIGNARVDIPVWNVSNRAYSVTSKPFYLPDGRKTEHIGSVRANQTIALLKALRPRQWLKNLLVFIPILAGHIFSVTTIVEAIGAFIAFCCCASSAYLLNDALDAPDDRLHPTKCHRPLAAGSLAQPIAVLTSVFLAMLGIGIGFLLGTMALGVLLIYLLTTVAYTVGLKRLMMVDIIVLSLLYCIRIIGGGVSSHIYLSFWLLGFSFFLFLSLALIKRYGELFNLERDGKIKPLGRGYKIQDKIPVGIMGINSAFLSIAILMLYLHSENVQILYKTPEVLYAILPLIVFWLGRLWMLSFRGEVNEDPVLYVSKDPISFAILLICLGLALLANF